MVSIMKIEVFPSVQEPQKQVPQWVNISHCSFILHTSKCMHLTGLSITLVFKDVQPLRHRMLVLHLEVPEGCPGGNSAPEHILEDLFMPTEDMTLS